MTSTDRDEDEPRHVGDYQLQERLASENGMATWLARQVSVGRTVILEELLDLAPEQREHFLAETRARAAVDHPFIASVYEAVDGSVHCFRASERLTGKSLQSMRDEGTTLEPVHLTRALRCVAEANLHHETNGRSTQPLAPGHIHMDGKHVTRIANLAATGHRGEGETARDVERLGHDLAPLVAQARPGTTRMLTLLSWMRGNDRPAPLQWREVIDLCNEIDRQLSAPAGAPANAKRSAQHARRALFLLGGFTLAALAIIILAAMLLRPAAPLPEVVDRPPPVLIPSGEYPTHDGEIMPHPAFLIDARETTIGEYREFLDTLDVLAADDRHRAFDHPEQPLEKTTHEPDDWHALLANARARSEWNGHPVSLDSPVPGVDWWDAMAYANWRKARLPTQEEWVAAIHHDCDNPGDIPAGMWHAEIPADCTDLTPAGIYSIAGSLREWTREPSINPSNPLGRRQHVVVGGSYLAPDGNALTREWVADPGMRRPDLGFRLVREVAD